MITPQHIVSDKAPAAIGPYSQAVKVGNLLFISGQLPLNPTSMEITNDSVETQAVQVFENLKAIIEEAGGTLKNIVKMNIYLSDMSHFNTANMVMERYCSPPYPARAALAVKELPKKVDIEIEAIACVE